MTELEQLRAESAAKDAALNATREALKGAAHFAEWAHHCEDGRADPKCDVCPAIDAARAALSLEAVKLAADAQARMKVELALVREAITELAVECFNPHPRMGDADTYRRIVDAAVTKFTNEQGPRISRLLNADEAEILDAQARRDEAVAWEVDNEVSRCLGEDGVTMGDHERREIIRAALAKVKP